MNKVNTDKRNRLALGSGFLKENLGIIIALIILCIFLSFFPGTSSSFPTVKNVFNVLRQISTNMLLACGMTMVIILGGINFSDMFLDLSGTHPASLAAAKESGAAVFAYGSFITAVINFLIIAFVVFMLIKAMNKLMPKKPEAPAAPAGPSELDVLKDILAAVKK